MKTIPTDQSMDAFLQGVASDKKRQDCQFLSEMMRRVTGHDPVIWGTSIVGFGRYHYKYASGRAGEFMLTGFSPRAAALSVYVMTGFSDNSELMDRLGKHKTGRSCLYIKKLDDINRDVLEEVVRKSVARMRELYPDST